MFRYYLMLGFRSLRRNPVLTLLMVITLAVGIGASMSTLTVLHVMSGDPIPAKSDRLFVPQLDNYPLQGAPPSGEPDTQMTYRDATNLLASKIGLRSTAIYGISGGMDTGRKDLPAFQAQGEAPTHDFFAMFEVPFRFGSAWTAAEDASRADVIVLSRNLSEKLFGDANPVGKHVRFADADYQIVGVLDNWKPLPRYYRLINGNGGKFGGEDQVFVPFATAVRHEMSNNGMNNCTGGDTAPGWQGWLDSECTWIQFWFEGHGAADQALIKTSIDNYVSDQKKLHRFPRPLNNRLYNVMEWLAVRKVVGADSKLQTWLAFGFLLVCLINAIGLLLAKFTARASEIGVRRALGAQRSEIFRQCLTEAGVIGLVGGAFGLLLSFAGLWLIARQSEAMAAVAHMDWAMLLLTLVLAVASSLIAGLLPTWRACQVTPAIQLKSQ